MDTTGHRYLRWSTLVGLVIAAVAVGYLVAGVPSRYSAMVAGQAGTETPVSPDEPDPIYDEQEAIARSLAELSVPGGHSAVARLTSGATLNSWRFVETDYPEPHVPVWIVGILLDGVSRNAVFPYVGPEQGMELIQGVYYAWDANAGWSLGMGELSAASPVSYESLQALQDEMLTIEPATPMPEETPE